MFAKDSYLTVGVSKLSQHLNFAGGIMGLYSILTLRVFYFILLSVFILFYVTCSYLSVLFLFLFYRLFSLMYVSVLGDSTSIGDDIPYLFEFGVAGVISVCLCGVL